MRPRDCFRHCPACGLGAEGGASPFVCRGCGFTFFFNAAIAAAVYIWRPDGRVLLIRRARDPGKGLLAPPGGFVDVGERAEDALRREIREEIGLELGAPRFLGSFPNDYPYRGVTYPVLDFFFEADAVDPEKARPLEDVAGIEWRDPVRELTAAELAFPSMRAGLELLLARGEARTLR